MSELRVPGATLHYQVQGVGPVLLISQSGEGDADRTVDLAEHLVDDFTVVTYDRRGLSRSVLDEPAHGATMAEHADDVHRLLTELTDQPVQMLGCSLGAVIGLHLAVEHPDQIGTLVAHEPVAPRLLPDDQRARHEHELAEVQALYAREGLPAAFKVIADILGIDPSSPDAEPGLTPQPMTPNRTANFDHFIRHDFSAVITDTLPVTRLARTRTRIVPAVGTTTPHHVFDYQCAEALAALVGTQVVRFPGGHNGNTAHPLGYATLLRQIFRP